MPSFSRKNLVVINGISRWFEPGGSSTPFISKSRHRTAAVDEVSLAVEENECIGLVGESGCGKTTLARILARLLYPSAGEIWFEKRNVWRMSHRELKTFRRDVRVIFQNQDAIFNPYLPVSKNFFKALKVQGVASKNYLETTTKLLNLVKLDGDVLSRYPNQLAGGQKRRISIARAFVGNPKLIIGDEPLASLDVFNQDAIVALLKSLRRKLKFSMVLITHDIKRINELAERIAIMYKGRIVETAPINANVVHPYSVNLIQASNLAEVDENDAAEISLAGRRGCLYRDLCPLYRDSKYHKVCEWERPRLLPLDTDPDHEVACHIIASS